MKFKALGALAGLALLAACSSGPSGNTMGGGGGMTPGGGPTPGSEQDLVANVGDRVFYDFNSSTLSSDADATLGRQAAWMAKYPSVDVLIAGNCDERGTVEYNLALGERRAHAAQNYLTGLGVAEARLSSISYGKEKPKVQGHDEESWLVNRNCQFMLQ